MQTKFILTSLAAIALSACGGDSSTSSSTPATPSDSTAADTTGTDTMAGSEATLYTFPADIGMLTVPDAITATSGVNSVTITGGVENPNPGSTTDGAYLTLGEEAETAMAGKLVRVSFMASGSGAAMVAYSTNDAGNSGWNTFELSPTPQSYSFEYQVPQLNRGRNDYIGIIPASAEAELNLLSVEYAAVE